MSESRRWDFQLADPAMMFVLSNTAAAEELYLPERRSAACKAQQAVEVLRFRTEPLAVRVVLDEALRPQEAGWPDRMIRRLEIPCGGLHFFGRVLEPSELQRGAGESRDEGLVDIGSPDRRDTVLRMTVPPGSYRVDVMPTIHSSDGELALKQAGSPTTLLSWWRQTRPGEAYPRWLVAKCVDDHARYDFQHDPERPELWTAPWEAQSAGELDIDMSAAAAPQFIIRLKRWCEDDQETPLHFRRMSDFPAAPRRLERFPDLPRIAVRPPEPEPLQANSSRRKPPRPADGIDGKGIRSSAASILHQQWVNTLLNAWKLKAEVAAGPPVELPLVMLRNLARLPLCGGSVGTLSCVLRVSLPDSHPDFEWPASDLIQVDPRERSTARWQYLAPPLVDVQSSFPCIDAAVPLLASAPAGTRLELLTWLHPKELPRSRRHVYCFLGELTDERAWRIRSAGPSDPGPWIESAGRCISDALAMAAPGDTERNAFWSGLEDELDAILPPWNSRTARMGGPRPESPLGDNINLVLDLLNLARGALGVDRKEEP